MKQNPIYSLILFAILLIFSEIYAQTGIPTGIFCNAREELMSQITTTDYNTINELGTDYIIHPITLDNINLFGTIFPDGAIAMNHFQKVTTNGTIYYHIYKYTSGYYSKWEAEDIVTSGIGLQSDYGVVVNDNSASNNKAFSTNYLPASGTDLFLMGPYHFQHKKYNEHFYPDENDIQYTLRITLRKTDNVTINGSLMQVTVKHNYDGTIYELADVTVPGSLLNDKDYKYASISYSYANVVYSQPYAPLLEPALLPLDAGDEYDNVFFEIKMLTDEEINIDCVEFYDIEIGIDVAENYTTFKTRIETQLFENNPNGIIDYWYTFDEPNGLDMAGMYNEVNKVVKDTTGRDDFLITTFNPSMENKRNKQDQFTQYYEKYNPAISMWDNYAVNTTWDEGEFTSINAQGAIFIHQILLNNAAEQLPNGYWYVTQACEDIDKNYRMPTADEMNSFVMLSLAHGAKGIFFYNYFDNIDGEPELYNQIKNVINPRMKGVLGQTLKDLTYTKDNYVALSIDEVGQKNTTRSNLNQQFLEIDDSTTRSYNNNKTYFIAGILDDPNVSNSQEYYFMVCNMASSLSVNRTLVLEVTAPDENVNFNNWRVYDVEGGLDESFNSSTTLTIEMEPGEGRLYKVVPVSVCGAGTFVANETISNDIEVPSGETLTINPGITLTTTGNLISVDGTIVFDGSSGNMAVLDFDEIDSGNNNQLFISNNGKLIMDYGNIKNAYVGLKVNYSTDISITNSTFEDCTYGAYFYGVDGSPIPEITNCSFTNNYYGVGLNGSDIRFSHNYFTNNTEGVTHFNDSRPEYGWSSTTGYNVFNGSFTGVRVWRSKPFLGDVQGITIGGYNTIDGSTYEMLVSEAISGQTITIMAENNCWTSTPPNIATVSGVSVDYDPTNCLFSSVQKSKDKKQYAGILTVNDITPFNDDWSISEKTNYAELLMMYDRYEEAENILNDIISLDMKESIEAIYVLKKLYKRISSKNVNEKLTTIKSKSKNNDIIAHCDYLEVLQSENDKNIKLEKLLKRKDIEDIRELILFNIFNYYFFEVNDVNKAYETATQMMEGYPKSFGSQHAMELTESIIKNQKGTKKANVEQELLPKEYELLGNFPNPFNPSTEIKYAMPSVSNVKLVIYDIMGREVYSFTYNEQVAGYNSIIWNGINSNGAKVASGIYIYRFEAKSLETQERFVKSAKMMLLK